MCNFKNSLRLAVCLGAIGGAVQCQNCSGDELIKVSVKGTGIDVVPSEVTFFSSHPKKQAKSMARKGGRFIFPEKKRAVNDSARLVDGSVVLFEVDRGVVYFFVEPIIAKKEIRGHAFRDGDIVYSFYVASTDERKAFLQQYKLSKHASTMWPGIKQPMILYRASRGYYVLLVLQSDVTTIPYSCPLHRELRYSKPGKCPRCGLELLQFRVGVGSQKSNEQ